MKQELNRLFTRDVNVTKNGEGHQIRVVAKEFANYKKVKVVIYGIEE